MLKFRKVQDVVRSYFKKQNWNFEEEKNVFHSNIALDGRTDGALLQLGILESAFYLLTIPAFKIPEISIAPVQEYIAIINSYLGVGCFYLDREDNMLVFRVSTILAEQIPSLEQVEYIFGYSIDMIENASEAVLDLIDGKLTLEQAVTQTLKES